ncbi:alpha-1,2-fucosyltransferase [Butyrivibrio sp. NC3005]|uniref:alpha-1,2-fucosyltransferase n=1 Tax=Butyrivibrio sp. NC3005 TaxID=1280685 RepID=UPI0003F87C9D|nr:alpha-1,2-fucosyltransferase [Butyrivibrio sp. NC3005]
MIIIMMQGGLGNQLFLYGLYKQLESLGKEVKMDEHLGFENDENRSPCLELLGLSYNKSTDKEVVKLRDAYMDIVRRLRRKIFGRKNLEYSEPLDGNFDSKVLELSDAYLIGYYQSEKYFQSKEVRSLLRSKIWDACNGFLLTDTNKKYRKMIEESESVSLHVRRGDYLLPGICETYQGICDDDYYKKSFEYISSRKENALFFIFSNDIEWCRKHYGDNQNVVFVEADGNHADISELFLMALCHNHILANSSFSWWGAWLSKDKEKSITIAPKKWLNNKNMTDIYTDDMILM